MNTKHYYICKYCYEEFIPKRRYVQKFCSNSCRSKAHHIKNRTAAHSVLTNATTVAKTPKKKKKKNKKPDVMSLAGVGNATGGSILAGTIVKLLTSEENKPATKGDLKALENKIGRYHKVGNMQPNNEGKWAYFDMLTKTVVFF